MTKTEARKIVMAFFRGTFGIDSLYIPDDFLKAEKVLGGRLSLEMRKLYEKALRKGKFKK